MKKIILAILSIIQIITISAQVTIKPAPGRGYEKRLSAYIDSLHVVDTHEHLLSTAEILKKQAPDFMVLLSHYSADDLKSAGLSDKTFRLLLKDSLSAVQKWDILQPFWDASSNTAYNRVALLAAEKLYNISDINASTVTVLSEKIRKAYKTDWISNVMNKGKIDYIIQMNPGRSIKNNRFRDVIWFDNYIEIYSRRNVGSIAQQKKVAINSLDDYVKSMETTFRSAVNDGVISVKSALAYRRTLDYANPGKATAEEIFLKLMQSDQRMDFTEVKPLQDYLMHRVLDLCRSNRIPFIFHTGLQSGNGNQVENSNPSHLVSLFREYPDVSFILLHGGYPFGGETSAIIKYFPNVYLDAAWIYAISPSFSERYLHEWLETIPASKIMAFGGDYFNIENTYAHLLFAKQVLKNVLTAKVRDGYFSEEEALAVAKKILHDNAIRIYHLS